MTAGIREVRRLSVLFALLLTLTPATAAGEGVNLAWNDCLGQGTGIQNVTFACNTNAGRHVLSGSFVLGQAVPDAVGLEIVLDLASDSATLPPWWTFLAPGSCRVSSLTADFLPQPTETVCADWANSLAVGGLAAYCTGFCDNTFLSANRARIKLVDAVPQADAQNLATGTEYFAFHLWLDHQKTVGAGACSGCLTPVCIVLNSIDVVGRGNVGSRKLTTSAAPGSDFASWQGGGVPVVNGVSGCPAATATRRSTWGGVRSLYR